MNFESPGRLTMLRKSFRMLPVLALSLGISGVPASETESANESPSTGDYQPPMRGELAGLADVEWVYRGDIIVTDVQGRFCEGFKCPHGRGELGTDGGWSYTGTFRYGDIVGKGKVSKDDEDNGEYSGLFLSTSFPGGPAPLCGEPEGEGDFPVTWPGYQVQLYADEAACTGRSCTAMQCLKNWVRSVDRQEVLPQQEAQPIRRWYEKARATQVALFNGQSQRGFDKLSVGGIDLRTFLVGKGWTPKSDSNLYIQRYLRIPGEPNVLQLILHKFETPYTDNPWIPLSEMLPMEFSAGPSVTVLDDPWTTIGLVIRFDRSGYVVTLPAAAQ